MGGMLLMNGVLQPLIYPLLNRHMGADQMGGALYIMGLVSISLSVRRTVAQHEAGSWSAGHLQSQTGTTTDHCCCSGGSAV